MTYHGGSLVTLAIEKDGFVYMAECGQFALGGISAGALQVTKPTARAVRRVSVLG
jgi:hypothetical protein